VPVLSATAVAADPSGKGAKKSQKDVSSAGTDSALENTLSWEDKVMGPDTNKKIDLKKIEAIRRLRSFAAKKKRRTTRSARSERPLKQRPVKMSPRPRPTRSRSKRLPSP